MAYHLKTRIAIAVSSLTILLMLAISLIAHSFFEKEFKSATFNYISDGLAVTADGLSARAHHALHVLELIRNSIPLDITDNPAEMQRFLDDLGSEMPVFDNGIILFSPEGKLLAVNPYQSDVIGMDFSFRDYIKYTVLNKQPYISAPIKSRQAHHHPIIMLTEPVLNADNEIVAILAGSLDLYGNNFLQALVNNKVGKNGYYMMLDQKETMVVHPDRKNILSSASNFLPRDLIVEFLLNSQGTIPHVTVNGREMLGAFRHVSPLNWTLVALTPLSESYEPIRKARIYSAASLLALFVLILLIVRILTNRLTSPLTNLTGKVRELADGDDISMIPDTGQYAELGDLSNSINKLVSALAEKRKDLKDQLAFLQNLIDTIPGPIFYKDAEYKYIGCNKAFESYIGIPRENLLGKSTFDIAPPELAKVYHQADVNLLEQGGEQVYEANVKFADGTIHDVIFYKKVFNDVYGNPAGMIGTFLDITDRKQSEQALRTSEQRFRLLVENAADAFFLHDEDGHFLDVNQQACISTGHTRDELLKMKVPDISLDYNIDAIKGLIDQLKTGQTVTAEDRHLRKDGSWFPTEVRLCYTEQNNGMVIALARDITERKQNEAILEQALTDAKAAKEQVDNILSSAADGIVVTNRRNRITHINQIAEGMIGITSKDLIGKPFTALFSNKTLREQAKAFLNNDRIGANQVDFKLNLSSVDYPRIIQARSSILQTDAGEQAGVVTLLRDVSRERELDQLKGEIISTAAHEMRTPLAVIMGYIEMLREPEKFGDFGHAQSREFLKEAYLKGEALTQIIDDLFDISRMEAGLPLPIDKQECNLNKLIEDVVSHYQKHTSKHEFIVNLAESADVMADANKMSQVFVNLISNAVKYSPDRGKINIRTVNEGTTLKIEIVDDGTGMTKNQLARVFDKFYRADSSSTAVTGLGIGMSIVKAIVEGHNGHIDIASTPGKGTHVTLTLPTDHC